ncbi:MAG: hypothetical protein KUG75_00560 [Pseudomonadales bacterium]|nr:hypothetical protein [Pseudomonadales bacterium]
MTIQDWGSMGELIGAIATVATLAYLAVQIRINTRIAKTSALQSMLAGSRDHFLNAMYSDGDVCETMTKGLNSMDALDHTEKTRFACFMIEQVLQMQDIMERYEADLVTEVDYLAWLEWTCLLFRSPGGRKVWPQVSAVTTSTINGVLNAHLKETPDGPSVLDIMPVFDRR